MRTIICSFCLLIVWTFVSVDSYNVLMFSFGQRSHKNVFDPIAEEMAHRGHQVTLMSSVKETAVVKGVENVHLKNTDLVLTSLNVSFFHDTMNDGNKKSGILEVMISLCNATLNEPEVQEIIHTRNGSRKYDVLVIDQGFTDYLLSLGYLLDVPTISLSTIFLMPSIAWSLNVPTPYSYVPMGFQVVSDHMSFLERAKNAIGALVVFTMFRGMLVPKFETLIREHIPDSPSLVDLERNVSLILLNTNPAIHPRRPTMPYIIEIGCIHCRTAKALPKELEDFMQESKDNGVVYFSLGSITKGTSMPEDMKKKVIEVFAKIPQKVLWKFEEDIPDLPQNVKLIKWAPQQDILGHPKVRLFISHGGGLSTQEAAYHGCPILGFPLGGDQLGNIANAHTFGYAEHLDWKTFSAEELLETILKMLNDPRYKDRASQLSKRLQDHPQPPTERAAYWIEYVIRHPGAPHLKSTAQFLNIFQYFLLDVIAVVVLILSIFLGVVFYLTKNILKIVCGGPRHRKKSKRAKKLN